MNDEMNKAQYVAQMKKRITLLSFTLIAVTSLFVGAEFAVLVRHLPSVSNFLTI